MKNLSRIQLELVADCILSKMNDLNKARSTVLLPETRNVIQKEIDTLHNILDIVCDNAAGKE